MSARFSALRLLFIYTPTPVKMSRAPSEASPAAACGGWAQQGSPLLINGTTSAYSIKTQRQPHTVFSPGLSELRLVV